jgi:anti-repressor protein
MQELIKIQANENHEPITSARELHEYLEINTPYKQWFDRMKEYGFVEKIDFATVTQKCAIANGGYQDKHDHHITIDMAKELCMIQRNEKGKRARHYFIAVEKEYNSPEKLMARALRIADQTINSLRIENETMKPKALFADSVATSTNSILIGELAKVLNQNGVEIGQNRLFERLREDGYLCKYGERRNQPTQKAMDLDLFEIKKRTINNPDGSIRTTTTTKVTGKGQIYFINRFLKERDS